MNTQKPLIAIKNQDGKQEVSARELHFFLGSNKDFSSWIKDRIERYGFVENQDYCLLTKIGEQNGRGGHNKIEYILTLDTAKELSMVEGNEKGKQARRYFIEMEKQAKLLQSSIPLPSTQEFAMLSQTLDKVKDLMKNYVPKMWQPHCENAIAPVDFSKIVKRCTKERPDVYVDNSTVAHYMTGEGFVKFSDGYYFPTQKGIDYGVFNINDIDFFQPDGQSMKFGLPVLTETGVAFIAPKLVDMRIREDFVKYPPIVS